MRRGPAVLVVALAVAGCSDGRDSDATVDGQPVGFEREVVTIMDSTGTTLDVEVWVADEPHERRQGLMDVTDLGEPAGMLFRFEDEGNHRFYMWQTPMPLSIAFFDASGEYVGSADMEPCAGRVASTCPRYTADRSFLTALEVRRGELVALGIGPGSTLENP